MVLGPDTSSAKAKLCESDSSVGTAGGVCKSQRENGGRGMKLARLLAEAAIPEARKEQQQKSSEPQRSGWCYVRSARTELSMLSVVEAYKRACDLLRYSDKMGCYAHTTSCLNK